MATNPITLIYCADGNKRFAQIAINAGFAYGARLPHRGLHFPIQFADQNWKKPNREKYITALAEHKPRMATVLDLEYEHQLPEVLEWCEEAAPHVKTLIVIPKAQDIVAQIPRTVAGVPIHLGYSVPTSYGGTELPLWEFTGWPVHLLGGSPQKQLQLRHYLDIQSVDGNSHLKAAKMYGSYWAGGKWITGQFTGIHDGIYEAFALSCANIMEAWRS